MSRVLAPTWLTVLAVTASAAASHELRRWTGRVRAAGRLGDDRPTGAHAPRVIVRALADAGVDADPSTVTRLWFLGVVGATASAAVLPAGRLLVVLAVAGPPVAAAVFRGRAARRRAEQIPGALDAVAAALRGGASLPVALGEAGHRTGPPLGDELTALRRRADSGQPLTQAVATWVDACDDADTRLAAAAVTVAADLGGPGADAVAGAAASLRERASARAESTALSVQARASAAVLTIAPIAFALLLSTIDPSSARFLLASPVGWACLAVGLGLDALGAWWMARLLRSAR